MLDVGVKLDGAVGATGQVDDDDFNAGTQELKNAVTRSGQTLSGANSEQVGEAMAINAGAASSCIDSGTANTVILTPTTGANRLKLPTTYALFNGWEVFFYIKETNTGNVTINIGQTVGIGAKKLLQKSGEEIPSGALPADSQVRARYDPLADSSTGAWVIDDSVLERQFYNAYLKFSDRKSAGTAGGASGAATTQVRDINTKDQDTAGIGSYSANQITLAIGTYRTLIRCPCRGSQEARVHLYDTTSAGILILGDSNYFDSVDVGYSEVSGRFTLTVESVLEIRHYTKLGVASLGLGIAVSDGHGDEVYTVAEFWRER